MYDSDGLLSVLDRSRRPRQARWLPALDTQNLARRENKQEDYWPVGVNDKVAHVVILKVRRITCRKLLPEADLDVGGIVSQGEEKYPHFPTPLLQELDLQFPLLRLDIAQGQLEEK